jgi:hypothetical protein
MSWVKEAVSCVGLEIMRELRAPASRSKPIKKADRAPADLVRLLKADCRTVVLSGDFS